MPADLRVARPIALILLALLSPRVEAQEPQGAEAADPAPPRHSVEPEVLYIEPGAFPRSGEDAGGPFCTLRVRYVVGEGGLDKRQALRLSFGYPTGIEGDPRYDALGGWLLLGQSLTKLPFASVQYQHPDAANYASVHCDGRPDVSFETRLGIERPNVEFIEIEPSEAVEPGRIIEFVLGDTSGGGPGLEIQNVPGHPYFVFFLQRPGSRYFDVDSGPFPRLLATARQVDNLYVSLPITPEPGVPFPVSVLAMQGHEGRRGNLLRKLDFVGELLLESEPPGALDLPATASFVEGSRGSVRVMATAHGPGPVTVRARLADRPEVQALGNIALVQESGRYDLAVGDNQRHSAAGGHAAAPEDELWLQHYERGDDYATIVQHIASELASWTMAVDSARRFRDSYDPNEQWFVPLAGYEWSARDRHHHVVFRGFHKGKAISDKPAPVRSSEEMVWAGNLDELLAELSDLRMGTVAIAHHSMWDRSNRGIEPYEWGPKEHPVRTTVEIFSAHGASDRHYELPPQEWEYPIHWNEEEAEQRDPREKGSVQDALAMGYRLGFVGGSDNHSWSYFRCGRKPDGGYRDKYGRQGLGVLLGDRSLPNKRQRLFQALQERRSYATTGHKSYLEVHFGAAVFGEEVVLPVGTELSVYAIASGVARPDRARFTRWMVWRDGNQLVHEAEVDTETLDVRWADPEPPLDDAFHPYYVQLIHDDAHVTWGTPIWVRYGGE